MSAEAASLVLQGIEHRFTLVWLDGDEYCSAIRRMVERGIVGGAIYDGLIAACALKSGAGCIYTWNTRHFDLLGPDIQKLVKMPPAV